MVRGSEQPASPPACQPATPPLRSAHLFTPPSCHLPTASLIKLTSSGHSRWPIPITFPSCKGDLNGRETGAILLGSVTHEAFIMYTTSRASRVRYS